MIKWSRVRLVLSILTAEGLWETWRERFQFAPGSPSPARNDAPRVETLPGVPSHYDYCGAAHVHSTHSDGTGTVPDIAQAASRAGLDFILLTDHNTLAARPAGEEGWHDGGRVLVAVGTEFATDLGHLLAFDVPEDFVPFQGTAVEAMRRIQELGGYGYIALPLDLKDHWRDFSLRVDGIGLEVFNLSSIARTKINLPGFLLALLRYRGKDPLTAFSYVAARPQRELTLWDDLTRTAAQRRDPLPFALGSLDAHAVMRLGRRSYPYPTYEQVFRTLRTHVLTPIPFTYEAGRSLTDLALLHDALKSGRSYVSYDNYADPTGFMFESRAGNRVVAGMGESYDLGEGDRITLHARAPRSRSIIRLYRDGHVLASARGGGLSYEASEPGVYRVEVHLYARRVGSLCLGVRPWIFSNPIALRAAVATAPARQSRDEAATRAAG